MVNIYQPIKRHFNFKNQLSCIWTTGRVVMYLDPCYFPPLDSLIGQCQSLRSLWTNPSTLEVTWPEWIREPTTLCSKVDSSRHLVKEETLRLPAHCEDNSCVNGHWRNKVEMVIMESQDQKGTHSHPYTNKNNEVQGGKWSAQRHHGKRGWERNGQEKTERERTGMEKQDGNVLCSLGLPQKEEVKLEPLKETLINCLPSNTTQQ